MKCLVVDDDPLTRDMVEGFLEQLGVLEYCLKIGDGATALHLLAGEHFDGVFLDLELPGLDGVSLIKALPRQTPVVVISASADFGAGSYEFGVVDYLVKPLELGRFAKAVARLQEVKASDSDKRPAAVADGSGALFLREGATIQRIDLGKLNYVEAQANYARFVFDDGSAIMSLVSMRRLEELLPGDFVRMHRSYIVNCRRIEKIEGSMVFVRGRGISIGQSYREQLLEKLGVIN